MTNGTPNPLPLSSFLLLLFALNSAIWIRIPHYYYEIDQERFYTPLLEIYRGSELLVIVLGGIFFVLCSTYSSEFAVEIEWCTLC